jgi:hypothetical protein
VQSRPNHPECGASDVGRPTVGTTGTAPVTVVVSGGRQTALWLIAVLLTVIATALLLRLDDSRLMKSAMAQTDGFAGGTPVGGRGIYAFSGQLTARTFGLFMLDVDTGTVWCYELQKAANDELQLRLVAARSWASDRYLEEFNVAEPVPGAVRLMVQQQRALRQGGSEPVTTTAPAAGPALPEEGIRSK